MQATLSEYAVCKSQAAGLNSTSLADGSLGAANLPSFWSKVAVARHVLRAMPRGSYLHVTDYDVVRVHVLRACTMRCRAVPCRAVWYGLVCCNMFRCGAVWCRVVLSVALCDVVHAVS